MKKLILIEGLSGTGKSTFATTLESVLKERGHTVSCWHEGELHPADLAWCALLTEEEFNKILNFYPIYREIIINNSYSWRNKKILSYRNLKDYFSNDIMEKLSCKEVFGGLCEDSLYYELFKKRWADFAKNSTGISIFESSFFQNHIREMLMYRMANEKEIFEFLLELLMQVKHLDPILIYLKGDISSTIDRAANQRKNSFGEKMWLNNVLRSISLSPYGKKNHLMGYDGFIEYCQIRRKIELNFIDKLPIKSIIIDYEKPENEEKVLNKKIEDILNVIEN